MTDIPDLDYAAFPLAVMYDWMQRGPGATGSMRSAQALGAMAPAFDESAGVIERGMRQAGLTWQGSAAAAASENAREVAQWASAAGQRTQTAGDQVDAYSQSFSYARRSVGRPIEVGTNSFLGGIADSGFGHVFGMQSDYAKRLAAAWAADDEANHALKSYELTSRSAVTGFPAAQNAPSGPGGGPAAGPGAVPGQSGIGSRSDTGGGAGRAGGAGRWPECAACWSWLRARC